MWLHLGALAFSLLLQVFSWVCPLTHLEVWLRERQAPGLAYPGSFIAHYAEALVYLEVSPGIIWAATLGVVFLSGLVYARAYWKS